MKTQILIVLFSLVFFHFTAISQPHTNDCNEYPGSSTKVFVFVGELLDFKKITAEERVNEARFLAIYRIIERVCGNYSGDTIRFNIIDADYDTSFARIKNQLLMLTKDTTEYNNYRLWGGLCFDVFKTKNNRWAVPFMEKNNVITIGQKALNPRKMGFAKDAFYDTKGMTKEEVGTIFYEPYYRIEGNKVFPVLGNSIEEVFRYEREGTLASAGAYERPTDPDFQIKEVEMAEIPEEDPDSVKQVLEKEFVKIKELLSKDPFDETQIRALIRNCGGKKDYSYCEAYFDTLLFKYPNDVCAYLVKAKIRHPRARLADTSRILVLQQAVKVDSNNYEANYELALSYYRLFHEQPGRHYAHESRKSFMRCAVIDTTELVLLKYPVIQLSHYLDDRSIADRYQHTTFKVKTDDAGIATKDKYNWYFPVEPLLRKKKNWETDYSVDIIHELDRTTYHLGWISEALAWFREPVLSLTSEQKVYRLSWFRSFDAPVVIRMENRGGEVVIYWKIAGPRDAEGNDVPAPEFSKKLSMRDWEKFEELLTGIDYWSMLPTEYRFKSTDGALWLLEGAMNGKRQLTLRPGDVYPMYTECLKYLIHLTDLKIPKNRMY
ncbi:MAG: hypothetical protein QM802_14085 [Agriterribacter sp.]